LPNAGTDVRLAHGTVLAVASDPRPVIVPSDAAMFDRVGSPPRPVMPATARGLGPGTQTLGG